MSVEQNKALVVRFFDEAFNDGNLAVIGELISPDIVYHAGDEAVRGHEGARQLVAGMRAAFPDFHVTPEDVIAEGDTVVIRFTDSGTHLGDGIDIPPTGKHVTWTGIDIFRITDGKIVEGWGAADLLGLMQQLGAIPAP